MLRKALLMNQARRSELIAPVLRSGDRRIEVEVTSVLCVAGSALSSEMQWHSCKTPVLLERQPLPNIEGSRKQLLWLVTFIYWRSMCVHTHVQEHRGQKKHMQELVLVPCVLWFCAWVVRPGSEQAPVLPGLCPVLQCELGPATEDQ